MDSLGACWQAGASLKTVLGRCRDAFALFAIALLVLNGCTYSSEEGVQWTAEQRRTDGALTDPPPPQLPEYPRQADLVRIDPGTGVGGQDYFIDLRSVSSSAGTVINYTIVIEERSGTRNVLYERMRCRTKDVKRYAYATADGRFRAREDARWFRMAKDGALGYQLFLYDAYFCDEDGFPLAERDIRNRLLGTTWTDDPALGR